MMKTKKSVKVNDLKNGMIIASNVEQNGNILLSKDITINDTIIDKLKRLYFWQSIEVYANEDTSKIDMEKKKEIQSNEIEMEFNQLSANLENLFNEIININLKIEASNIKEIREFAKKIQNEIKSTSIVIKNIVLYGSGRDTIYRHGINVAALSALLGQWIGLEQKQLNLLIYSAILHDFGKMKIDKKILNKMKPLTRNELNIIKTHPNIGYQFIKDIPFLDKSVSYGVLMHHERLDGSGYPLGLKESNIHQFAKIIAIADVFDAINSNRGYKTKKPPFEAMQIVKAESLGKIDYEYSKIFLEHISNYYMGEEVLLNTNEVCKIIQININNLEKPLVLKDGEFIDLNKEKGLFIKEIIL